MKVDYIRPGTPVLLNNDGAVDGMPIKAVVRKVTLTESTVDGYFCVWWDGSDRCSEWVEVDEVEPDPDR